MIVTNKICFKLLKHFQEMFPKYVLRASLALDEITLVVSHKGILPILMFLKNHSHFQFNVLVDVTAVDFLNRKSRFEVVYNLISTRFNFRIRVKTIVNEITAVDSVGSVFSSGSWYEREIWDIYGIWFNNHNDLRRILTDYGFEGFPLRKDFPITGYTESRYDTEKKCVISEPLELPQEFRTFNLKNPWIKDKNSFPNSF
jgi:NADH dehydrogenase (ubiquinone) Fe-S protein 3